MFKRLLVSSVLLASVSAQAVTDLSICDQNAESAFNVMLEMGYLGVSSKTIEIYMKQMSEMTADQMKQGIALSVSQNASDTVGGLKVGRQIEMADIALKTLGSLQLRLKKQDFASYDTLKGMGLVETHIASIRGYMAMLSARQTQLSTTASAEEKAQSIERAVKTLMDFKLASAKNRAAIGNLSTKQYSAYQKQLKKYVAETDKLVCRTSLSAI